MIPRPYLSSTLEPVLSAALDAAFEAVLTLAACGLAILAIAALALSRPPPRARSCSWCDRSMRKGGPPRAQSGSRYALEPAKRVVRAYVSRAWKRPPDDHSGPGPGTGRTWRASHAARACVA